MPFSKLFDLSINLKLLLWEITEEANELEKLYTFSETERILYEKNSLDVRKKEWLASRILHKQIVGKGGKIFYDQHGKPFSDSGKQISISHTKNYVIIAVDEAKPVGIDIELITERIIKLKDKFVGDDEELLLPQFKKYSLATFYHVLWSFKEAAYKLHGAKELIFATQIIATGFDENTNILTGYLLIDNQKKKVRTQVIFYNGYVIGVSGFEDV